MPDQSEELSEIRARLSAVESRVEMAVADAAAARHLAAARDRDLADLTVKVDAVRSALNGHSVQTAARFDRLEHEMRTGFADVRAEMRTGFGVAAAAQQRIVDLLTGLIERGEGR